jgi:hypothetical protein
MQQRKSLDQAPVTHTCNPSYLGGRDQQDGGLKPVQASLQESILKRTFTQEKGRLVEWLKV